MNDDIVAMLREHKVQLLNFPVRSGFVMDPCDNHFHGDMKTALANQLTESWPRSAAEEVRQLARAYRASSESVVRRYFRQCGLDPASDQSAETIVVKLLHEYWEPESVHGRGNDSLHSKQRNAFVKAFRKFRATTQGGRIQSLNTCINSKRLDGVYWDHFRIQHK